MHTINEDLLFRINKLLNFVELFSWKCHIMKFALFTLKYGNSERFSIDIEISIHDSTTRAGTAEEIHLETPTEI